MVLSRIAKNGRPAVQQYEEEIAVWAGTDADPIGLLIAPESAIAAALDMLSLASGIQGGRPIMLKVRSIELLQAVKPDHDIAARLIIDTRGVSFAFDLGATDLAELAAGLTIASQKIG